MKKYLLIILLIYVSCAKEDPPLKISESNIEITYGSEHILTTNYPALWSVDQDFFATVNSGIVKARKVGEARITASYEGESVFCKVKIIPTINYYKDPFQKWGASKAEVKASEGPPDAETEDALLYGKTLYAFKYGKLDFISVLVSQQLTAYNHLNQRMDFLGENGGFYFFSCLTSIAGLSFHSSLGWNVLYFDLNTFHLPLKNDNLINVYLDQCSDYLLSSNFCFH
jgi:hypothetical protein